MGLARYDPGADAGLMETKDEVISCCTNILSIDKRMSGSFQQGEDTTHQDRGARNNCPL